MDSAEFSAHSVGFFKRADQWLVRRSSSQPNAPPPSPQSADMSKHVFAVDTDDGERTSATLSNADEKMARGPPRPSSCRSVPRDQPPQWRTGDIALWCERSAGGGQRFSTVMVEERAAGETTPGPADAGTLPVTDGAFTFEVDARDLLEVEIPAALAPAFVVQRARLAVLEPLPPPPYRDRGPVGLALAGWPHERRGRRSRRGRTRSAASGGQGWSHRPDN